MNHAMKKLGAAAMVALAVGAAVPLAHAGSNDDATEAKAFLNSGMTLEQAIGAAEADRGGTAMSAAWEHADSGTMVFEVELAKTDGTVTTVQVDPANGSVTTMGAVDQDQDDDGETDDD